jgi:hypothetical protein
VIGTRRTLFRLWIWLLAATVIALAAAVVAIDLGRRDANALRTGLAPAREGVAAARESLVAADTEALIQFDALACDCAKLNQKVTAGANRQQVEQQKDSLMSAGPGDVFWSVFTTAGGQLAQVSQADLGGPAVEGVQVVTGLLNRYTGLIEQAFRNDPTSMLSRAYMQYAHNFLRNEVLSQLDKLRNDVDQAAPRRPPWGRHLLWALPLAALIALLASAHVECPVARGHRIGRRVRRDRHPLARRGPWRVERHGHPRRPAHRLRGARERRRLGSVRGPLPHFPGLARRGRGLHDRFR